MSTTPVLLTHAIASRPEDEFFNARSTFGRDGGCFENIASLRPGLGDFAGLSGVGPEQDDFLGKAEDNVVLGLEVVPGERRQSFREAALGGVFVQLTDGASKAKGHSVSPFSGGFRLLSLTRSGGFVVGVKGEERHSFGRKEA